MRCEGIPKTRRWAARTVQMDPPSDEPRAAVINFSAELRSMLRNSTAC